MALTVTPGLTAVPGQGSFLGNDSGAADAMVVTPTQTLASYTSIIGNLLVVKANATNATTTPTINVSGLGTKTIVKRASTALAAGDIVAGMMCLFVYDGTNFQLTNPVVN
jgi:hypothetical protein